MARCTDMIHRAQQRCAIPDVGGPLELPLGFGERLGLDQFDLGLFRLLLCPEILVLQSSCKVYVLGLLEGGLRLDDGVDGADVSTQRKVEPLHRSGSLETFLFLERAWLKG